MGRTRKVADAISMGICESIDYVELCTPKAKLTDITLGKDEELTALVAGKTPFYITVGSEERNRVPKLSRWFWQLSRTNRDVRFDILQGLGHGEACTQAFTTERLDWIFFHK